MLIPSLIKETCFKQVGTGATKDWKSCGKHQKHLFETIHRQTGSLLIDDSIMQSLRGASSIGLVARRETYDFIKDIVSIPL